MVDRNRLERNKKHNTQNMHIAVDTVNLYLHALIVLDLLSVVLFVSSFGAIPIEFCVARSSAGETHRK